MENIQQITSALMHTTKSGFFKYILIVEIRETRLEGPEASQK